MNEKKMVVPEGMLKAAHKAWGENRDAESTVAVVKAELEAALRWLSENPIVPTPEQFDSICKQFTWLDRDSVRYGAREWQKQMFNAPIPSPNVARVRNAVAGCTLTREEADEIMRYVSMCVPPGQKAGTK